MAKRQKHKAQHRKLDRAPGTPLKTGVKYDIKLSTNKVTT